MKQEIYVFNSYLMNKLKGNQGIGFSDDSFALDTRKQFMANYSGVKRVSKTFDYAFIIFSGQKMLTSFPRSISSSRFVKLSIGAWP